MYDITVAQSFVGRRTYQIEWFGIFLRRLCIHLFACERYFPMSGFRSFTLRLLPETYTIYHTGPN